MIPLLAVIASAIRIATPLALAASGETIAERSGVIDVGIEGIMLGGACAAFLVALATGSALAGAAAAVAVGLLLALLLAFLVLELGADQVVTGLGLNLVAAGASASVYRLAVGETGTSARLGELGTFMGQEPIAWAAALLAFGTWWLLARSTWGVAVRATGDAPLAAEAAGIPVVRVRLAAVLAGGALAALAGADLVLAHASTFTEDVTGGRGFMALAIVLFGRWSPAKVALAALFFGGAEALELHIQARGGAPRFQQLVIGLPYVLSLAVLAVRKRGRDDAPAALGVPYRGGGET